MTRRTFLMTAAALTALAAPAFAGARDAHVHKVVGTVAKIDSPHVAIKTADGNTVTVMLDKDTVVTRGTEKVDASTIAVGDRITVAYTGDTSMLMARTVQLGARR